MKIISIGTDRKLFEENSAVRQRIVEYGKLVEEMHIIVLSQKSKVKNQNDNVKLKISENVWIYPTNSKSRWMYIFDAVKIGEKIISDFATSYRLQAISWLITCQDPFECGLVGWRLARKFRLPLQLQVHTDFLSPYFCKDSFLNRTRVLLGKFLVKRARCVRVVSQRIKQSLLSVVGRRSADKVSVLPIFVDIKKIENAPVTVDLHKKYPQFNFIILMASRFSREKNIPLAIKAMAEVVNKYPETGMIIVGEGQKRKKYESIIKNYKIANNVRIEDWSDDLISYYKTADLFLLTSNYEGYGMSVVEAMAAHCPVVMTDVGLAGSVIKNDYNGIVVPVGDKGKIVEAISKMIDSKPLRYNFVVSAQSLTKEMISKEEYLEEYKKGWEACILDKKS